MGQAAMCLVLLDHIQTVSLERDRVKIEVNLQGLHASRN